MLTAHTKFIMFIFVNAFFILLIKKIYLSTNTFENNNSITNNNKSLNLVNK